MLFRSVRALAKNDRGLVALVPVHDPAAVASAWDAPVGSRVSIVLRGTPGYDQPAVPLEATVGAKDTGDFGRVVRLDVGTFHVAIAERAPLPIHPSFWRKLGISPRRADVVVQKNFFHYRMFYLTTSFRHLPVVSQGATSFDRVRARTYRVPTHPGTKLDDWRASDPILRGARAGQSVAQRGARLATES